MASSTRRFLHGASVALALCVAYTGGVVTGALGADEDGGAARPKRDVIDQAAKEIARSAAHPVSRGDLERAAIDGMVGALDDRWSRHYSPREYQNFQTELQGSYSGIGVWLQRSAGDRIQLSTVLRGSPADRAGLRTGDQIVRVAGRSVALQGAGMVAERLRGAPGSQVALTVRREAELRRFVVTREAVGSRDVSVRRLRGDVLLSVREFTRGTGRDVRAAVSRQASRDQGGIILDLRDNPGGLLAEAVETASAFLDGGPVVSYRSSDHGLRELHALGPGETTVPLVVLVNGGTASGAEVVAGALQDRNRAVIVGSRTFGKGSIQETLGLRDGSALELTVGRYYTPSGRSIDDVGIDPDVLVPPDSPPQVAERRAREVLSGLLAALPTDKERG